MEWLGSIGDLLGFILVATLIVLFIIALLSSRKNNPTWKGIIISAMMGCLPFYLILCFFGIMGDEIEKDDEKEKPKPKKKPKAKKRDEFDYENADDYGPEYENADKYGAEFEVER